MARQDLDEANTQHATLLETARRRGTVDQDMRSPNSALARAYAACQEAEKNVWRAQAAYAATPDGMRELKIAATRLEDRLGDQVHKSGEYQRILDRIREGRMRRDEQLQAYKAANTGSGTGSPPLSPAIG